MIIARHLRLEQPGFWPFVYLLIGRFPGDVGLLKEFTSIFVNEFPWGYLNDGNFDSGLEEINRQLLDSSVPPHGRAFLEQVKAELTAMHAAMATHE